MPRTIETQTFAFDRPGNYRIRVLGILDESWSERLAGLRIRQFERQDHEKPVTELFGKIRDQAELSGLLNTLYELHLTLLSVEYLGSGKRKEVEKLGR